MEAERGCVGDGDGREMTMVFYAEVDCGSTSRLQLPLNEAQKISPCNWHAYSYTITTGHGEMMAGLKLPNRLEHEYPKIIA
jgi:hypothetical protein